MKKSKNKGIRITANAVSMPFKYCNAYGADSDKSKRNKFMHVSIDDTTTVFTDLAANKLTYKSIFENPNLAFYKELHDTYGSVISLYCYLDPLSKNYSDLIGYTTEFKKNSNWLKFGLHSPTETTTYINRTYDEAKTDWDTFVSYVVDFTGTIDSIDRFPRLHYYAGNLGACKGFRDAKLGALGFLAADDTRNSYYLAELNDNKLIKKYKLKFESGEIISNKLVADKTMLRTVKAHKLPEAIKVSFSTAGKYMIAYTEYSSKGEYVYKSMFHKDTVTIPKSGYYKFMIKTISGTDNLYKSASKIEKQLKITSDFNKIIYNHDYGYDNTNLLYFTRTDFRMESIGDISKTLSDLNTSVWENQIHPLIIFTHEVQLSNPEIKNKLKEFLQYALDNGYSFDFPQNHLSKLPNSLS